MASCGMCRAMGPARPGSIEAGIKLACLEGRLKGPPRWLKPVKRERLPPRWTLPYSGGWVARTTILEGATCSIDAHWRMWRTREVMARNRASKSKGKRVTV